MPKYVLAHKMQLSKRIPFIKWQKQLKDFGSSRGCTYAEAHRYFLWI